MKRGTLATIAVLVTTGCGSPPLAPAAPEVTGPPLPTSWTLGHDVIASDRIRVVGGSISAYEQSIEVVVGASASQPADRCLVQADVSGEGGPDRWVGEKIPTSVRGVPALRNGAGAEGPFLMWQDGNHRWMTVQCEHEATMPVVADQVRPGRRSHLRVPFGLTLPDGYAVSSLDLSQDPLDVRVSLDRLDRAYDESLDVTLRPTEQSETPTGEPTAVGGRPGLLTRNPKFPRVCLAARQTPAAYVCVGIPPDDTGPYPDRTDDLPTIEAIAASLRFADLNDPATWFDADQALR